MPVSSQALGNEVKTLEILSLSSTLSSYQEGKGKNCLFGTGQLFRVPYLSFPDISCKLASFSWQSPGGGGGCDNACLAAEAN